MGMPNINGQIARSRALSLAARQKRIGLLRCPEFGGPAYRLRLDFPVREKILSFLRDAINSSERYVQD
jgi:hypothetical protein